METHSRTVLKTLSWRAVATVVTGLLGWTLTGSASMGVALGASDTVLKFLLYYAHERAWARVGVGYRTQSKMAPQKPD